MEMIVPLMAVTEDVFAKFKGILNLKVQHYTDET